MKITDFKALYLEIPFPEPGMRSIAYGVKKSWGFTLVKVFTDEGIVGIGGQNSNWPGAIYWCKLLNEAVKPILIERIVDPCNVGIFSSYLRALPPSSPLSFRPSCIEVALWDAIGKKARLPIYKILGARQNKVKAYLNATTKAPRWEPNEIADFASKKLDKGFRAIKLNIYNTEEVQKDLECVKAVRKAVGSEMEIMVDAQASLYPWGKRSFSYNAALKIAHELEKNDVLWLEDIIRARIHPELCARLAAEVEILIASGGQLFGAHTLGRLMDLNALDIVQPDVMHVGGIGELVKVASLAEIYGKICSPHTGYTPGLVTAATLQAACATNISYVEFFEEPYTPIEVRDSILTAPIDIDKDGYLRVPQKPGIGVELNEELVEKFAVS